ncbi:hypoxanthine phosphoribosyltransferase [Limosilactobacillus sp. STM2_1]|uniref:Hypoxanthine phosphoribosyltransferase n=1 Tax=Limosilactobacillus rudii TaxID=2759755 RepID=A0A7W3UKP4_9LACO|nr:hypoxanthine phosphoribosyltransferase [Limosilactobacillus rudii]MBB1079195.1 hypoxanthine phosphoribosyltransferase [Limosilactobacillus rudii]MBB1097284.1 hypoxanthine phosphoribosyltransferase [Limosilactobacillus rudii]MCD7134393.1 hypoxanthine phosphoribosyltransferase [Limosilactobacillus rudii]
MNNDIEKILYTQEQVSNRISELATTISTKYQDEFPVVVPVMTGAMIFASELMQKLDFKLNIDYVDVSSYEDNSQSSGRVRLLRDLSHDVNGRSVLIVEDIIDSGHTLQFLNNLFASRGAKSIETCSLLDKPARREVDVDADYVGFKVPNEFIVGYGLDYDGRYRNMPYVGVLKRSVYEN